MNKFYSFCVLTAFCLLTLTSCNPRFHFATQGLRNTDSSYVITRDGKHVDAEKIVVRYRSLKIDGKETPFSDVSLIHAKKMLFTVKNGELYCYEMYGKICLLYQLKQVYVAAYGAGTSYTASHYALKKFEYLEKKGTNQVDSYNDNVLIDYVSDNEEALAKAKGSKTWGKIRYIPMLTFAGGVIWTGVDLLQAAKTTGTTPDLGPPLIVAGLSIPAFILTSAISNHKMYKAIKIYNRE